MSGPTNDNGDRQAAALQAVAFLNTLPHQPEALATAEGQRLHGAAITAIMDYLLHSKPC